MLKLQQRNLDWMDKALCKELPSDMFFPESSAYVMVKEAKKACSLCAVRLECLDYALSITGLTGVFGGTTEYDRIRMKRKMKRDESTKNPARPHRRLGACPDRSCRQGRVQEQAH